MITLFEELIRKTPLKLKRDGVRTICLDPSGLLEQKTASDEGAASKKKFMEYIAENKSRLIPCTEVVEKTGLPRMAVANAASWVNRKGWIDVIRIKKRVHYKYVGGF